MTPSHTPLITLDAEDNPLSVVLSMLDSLGGGDGTADNATDGLSDNNVDAWDFTINSYGEEGMGTFPE